jgi:Lon protease-like protein
MKPEADSPQKVALFPIPNMVTFPDTRVPLHVFEPRYRAMIKHCVDKQMMLAIAHTKKIKGKAKSASNKVIEDVSEMNKNQTSYEPHKVFSAGFCEVIETTEDGRMHIEVQLNKRLQIVEINQEIPFQIATCVELIDLADTELTQLEQDKKEEIYSVLLAISQSQSPQLYEIINQPDWRNLSPAQFSFKVFEYFRFEADFMQHVLEQTSVSDRLDLIWQGITQGLKR